MSECKQAEKVQQLLARESGIEVVLSDLRAGQNRVIELMEEFARQSEQIKTLFKRQGDNERGIQVLFDQQRQMQLDVSSLKEYRDDQRKHDSETRQYISAPIVVGLIIVTIVAVVAFGLYLVDTHNYTSKPAVQGVNQ